MENLSITSLSMQLNIDYRERPGLSKSVNGWYGKQKRSVSCENEVIHP